MADLSAFKAAFKGDIVTPDHPEYEQALSRWAANSRRRAAIVAFVRETSDVSLALKYARAARLDIAVRGGGHNPAGASSVKDGLVIDLSRYFSGTRVDPEKRLAFIGGGALWSGVNEETMKYNLATTGGTVSHTGAGGLILGGGFGYLSGSHGLAIDNLVQATVIIADGTVLTASETENPDLFWGIRGGGSNFGVVTEFVMQLHPQRPTVFGGTLIFHASAMDDVMKVIIKKYEAGFVERETFNLGMTLLHDPNQTPAVMLMLFWNGSEEEGRENYKDFFAIEPKVVDATREMSYAEVNTLLDEQSAVGNNYYLKSVDYLKPNADMVKQCQAAAYELARKHGITITFLFEFWNLKKINAVPADATAFQRTPRLSSLAAIQYPHDTPEQLATVRNVAEQLTKLVTAAEGDSNVNNGYANYNSDAPSLLDPYIDSTLAGAKAQALFGTQMARLRELKRKYDPEMMFNKWYVIEPSTI